MQAFLRACKEKLVHHVIIISKELGSWQIIVKGFDCFTSKIVHSFTSGLYSFISSVKYGHLM